MTNPYFKASSSAKPHLVRGPGGLKGEIWKLRLELEAAFDQLAGGGGGDLVIFKGDGSPQSGNTFGKWSDLMNFLSPLQAMQSGLQPRVRMTQSFAVPLAGMPPTGWPMASSVWESVTPNTGVVSLTVPAGVTLDMMGGISTGVGIICNPSVDGETFKFSQQPPGSGPWIFQASNGSTLTHNVSTKALVSTAGAVDQTYFVFAAAGCTWLTPLSGPIVKASGNDVVIGSMIVGGYQGVPDGWAESASATSLLLYQNNVSSTFPAVSWAGFIFEMFNGTDSLQINMRHGVLADRAALAALPGGYALKPGRTFFATDYGANGGQLIWTGSVWVDGTGAVVP